VLSEITLYIESDVGTVSEVSMVIAKLIALQSLSELVKLLLIVY